MHNLKQLFMLYEVMKIYGNFKFKKIPTNFSKKGNYDKMFPFQRKSHDGDNSPHKKSLNPIS